MSFGRTKTVVIVGVSGHVIDVEVDVGRGLPKIVISGKPDSAVAQAPTRIQAAMGQSELPFPDTKVTINLSPAGLPKHGAGLDLAMAVALLSACGVVGDAEVKNTIHIGELGMDGSLRSVPGVLPAVIAAYLAGHDEVIVPAANAAEASLVDGIAVRAVENLGQVVAFHRARANGKTLDLPVPPPDVLTGSVVKDLKEVVGQHEARRALEIAAAGGHNFSMVGPPGAGKTLLASRMPSILPKLSRRDSLEVSSIHSILGELPNGDLLREPPFVAPHHSATMAALVGGGGQQGVKPGEISKAHAGVLFLDEAPEFKAKTLDALRQPLEHGIVTIARAQQTSRFPCRFQLILARNPCPCGRNFGDGSGCTCTSQQQQNYAGRLSGPLLDRVDIHLQVYAVTRADLMSGPGESSAVVADRVAEARERAAHRWHDFGYTTNSQATGALMRASKWVPAREVTTPIDRALDRGDLSLRGYDRILKLAWTIADLAGASKPGKEHLFEALTLRDSQAVR